jgi:glycosyltransferase involved in cell wall biosynthesis
VKVGFFSPLPPARSGVADYAATLLRYLRSHGSVEVAPDRADVNLYHLGNNQLHAEIYDRALREPGVAVLHDAVLHHFFLGSLTREQYVSEFAHNYGDWTRGLADSLWRTRARSAADHRYFSYPMLKRICEASRTVIVHNPAAAAMVYRHASTARVLELPMLVEPRPSPSPADIDEVRGGLGVGPGTPLAGIFGHLRESKRLMAVLRVFRRLPEGRLVLLLAGEIASPDLARAVECFERETYIRRLPYTPEPQFRSLGYATDICINLRHPAAGETSAITVALMAAGKPVILTDSEEVRRLPHDSCIRIRSGLTEEAELEEVLLWLSRSREDRRAIGARAARYIAANHAPEAVASLFWKALCDARS